MRRLRNATVWTLGLTVALAVSCKTPTPPPAPEPTGMEKIKHILFIVKENRTFDNYFGQYTPQPGQTIEARTFGVAVTGPSGATTTYTTPLTSLPDMVNPDIDHSYQGAASGGCNYAAPGTNTCPASKFPAMAGFTCSCNMDSFNLIKGSTAGKRILTNYTQVQKDAPAYPQPTDINDISIPNYWKLADNFVLSDFFFSSHRGPSFVNHLFTIGGQSGGLADDDDDNNHLVGAIDNPFTSPSAQAPEISGSDPNYASYNGAPGYLPADIPRMVSGSAGWGCDAPGNQQVNAFDLSAYNNSPNPPPAAPPQDKASLPNQAVYPCFDFKTLGDELSEAGISWRMYGAGVTENTSTSPPTLDADNGGYIWTAYNAIRHVRTDTAHYFSGTADSHVARVTTSLAPGQTPQDDLIADIQNGTLPSVVWISTPMAVSEHPAAGATCEGENWTVGILNALAANPDLWNSTAVFISWDDFGGFYDHVPPPDIDAFGFGFRVPMLTVSPYAKKGVVDHKVGDFSSVLKFIEKRYNLAPLVPSRDGNALISDLTDNFDFTQAPRPLPTLTPQLCSKPPLLSSPAGLAVSLNGALFATSPGTGQLMYWLTAPTGDVPPNVAWGVQSWNATETNMNNPQGVAVVDGNVYVADTGFNRLLGWSSFPAGPGPGGKPIAVFGQSGFTAFAPNRGGATAATGSLSSPAAVYADLASLYVADTGNNRVLVWTKRPVPVAGSPIPEPDLVLGQPDFESNAPSSSPGGMSAPNGIAVDGTHLYVADSGNNRILIWNTLPLSSGQPAELVLGKPAGGVSAQTLSEPGSVFVNAGTLYVADTGNNRVLSWKLPIAASYAPATGVLGQATFSSNAPTQMLSPSSAVVAPSGPGGGLYVSDTGNNRILIWSPLPGSAGVPASGSVGAGLTAGH